MIARRPGVLAALAAALLVAACAQAPSPSGPLASTAADPEAASGYTPKPGWRTTRFAVAAANPLAADAGHQVLKAGGSAVDAAIAVQLVLGLVEPQSSGIGGGAFLLHAHGGRLDAYDGRETAPAAADERLFLTAEGKPLPFDTAVTGGRAVGVPGVLRMLELAHTEHGRLPWASLFEPAIRLARDGFPMSARLHALAAATPSLRSEPAAAAYLLRPDGTPHPVGHLLRNPEYAATLTRIAREGSDAFHRGEIAQAVVEAVQKHPRNPGRLSLGDLAGYQPKKREPLCFDHVAKARALRVCGLPPPASGTLAIGQMLGILRNTDADALPLQDGLPSPAWLHLYTEAARLAFADRAQYVGDPDFVQPPAGSWTSLLDSGYLATRARLIGERSLKVAPAGVPGPVRVSYAPADAQPASGTSHITIVDAEGRALAMTTSVEQAFGARLLVKGFFLNNQLTDFNFVPADAQGRPVANRVEPGKRPRSSMSPVLVLGADGQLVLAAGSAGGSAIIHHTAKVLYGVLHWGLDVQQAIDLPNFGSANGPTVLEQKRFPRATLDALRGRGAEVREQAITSGLHAVQKTPTGYFGGADPRREGVVTGE